MIDELSMSIIECTIHIMNVLKLESGQFSPEAAKIVDSYAIKYHYLNKNLFYALRTEKEAEIGRKFIMSKKQNIQLIKDPTKYWKCAYLCQLGLKRRLSKKFDRLIKEYTKLYCGAHNALQFLEAGSMPQTQEEVIKKLREAMNLPND